MGTSFSHDVKVEIPSLGSYPLLLSIYQFNDHVISRGDS